MRNKLLAAFALCRPSQHTHTSCCRHFLGNSVVVRFPLAPRWPISLRPLTCRAARFQGLSLHSLKSSTEASRCDHVVCSLHTSRGPRSHCGGREWCPRVCSASLCRPSSPQVLRETLTHPRMSVWKVPRRHLIRGFHLLSFQENFAQSGRVVLLALRFFKTSPSRTNFNITGPVHCPR